ncbi:MAG: 4a-hydroxytetrahydrobiopterin dehydratase [Gaiellales bacterium]
MLAESELQTRVAGMPGWEVRDGALEKAYACGDFDGSIAFVNRVAHAAAEADHHPDIAVSWDTVTLRWVSHSEGGITEHDVEMAGASDTLA